MQRQDAPSNAGSTLMDGQRHSSAPDRPCDEYLACPRCKSVDVDFRRLEYKKVQCSFCHAVVRVTGYKVALGPPEEPWDYVGYIGVVESSAGLAEGA